VGVIGVGKFACMFLAQTPRLTGIRVVALCDKSPERARQNLARLGSPGTRLTTSAAERPGDPATTLLTDDPYALIRAPNVEVVVEATGDPSAGVEHALECCAVNRHIVMVNVEADALAGPALAQRAEQAGVVYSLAYGDQPALIVELVDWARTAGFEVICAGKGTKYLPEYHDSTPDTVWEHYGVSTAEAAQGGMNPKMFNSFLDGSKSAIEMAAVANATGLGPQADGLRFPACDTRSIASMLKPKRDGGLLDLPGTVEVVSSLNRDGTPVDNDLRWGVYVCFAADSTYIRRCFSEYGLVTDPSGRYAALYRPYHLIGMELAVSIAHVALRAEPTGAPRGLVADVAAVAKRDLAAGETLDGEGGFTVWGRLMRAADALEIGALPIGLANGVRLKHAVPRGDIVRWSAIEGVPASPASRLRREMEKGFSRGALATH
jgi:predicted homoserine dehydrogenase-like protein